MVANGVSPRGLFEALGAQRSVYCGFIGEAIRQQVLRIDLKPFGIRRAPYRLAVAAGRYVVVKNRQDESPLFDLLDHYIDSDVDCVVEFGSGMGDNLRRLRLRNPGLSPTYIACEPSSNGRQITRMLFADDATAKLQLIPFDYRSTTLDFLNSFRRVVAFTNHSIEQIPVLGEPFYRRLLDTPIAACVHWEPIGWQRYTHLVADVQALQQDKVRWTQHRAQFVFRISDDALSVNAASWAATGYYNTDLLRLVADAATRSEIKLTALGYDLEGHNPFNPSTLLAWTRCPV